MTDTSHKLTIIVAAEIVGDTGPDYGNQEVTPQFIAEYLIGAGNVIVPGVSFIDATVAWIGADGADDDSESSHSIWVGSATQDEVPAPASPTTAE